MAKYSLRKYCGLPLVACLLLPTFMSAQTGPLDRCRGLLNELGAKLPLFKISSHAFLSRHEIKKFLDGFNAKAAGHPPTLDVVAATAQFERYEVILAAPNEEFLERPVLPGFRQRHYLAALYKVELETQEGGHLSLELSMPANQGKEDTQLRLNSLLMLLKKIPSNALRFNRRITLSAFVKTPEYVQARARALKFPLKGIVGDASRSEFTVYADASDTPGIQNISLHELGHNVHFGTWLDKPGQEWRMAMKRDGRSVSSYGDVNLEEDFAETVGRYLETLGPSSYWTHQTYRGMWPHRFAILDTLLNPSHPLHRKENHWAPITRYWESVDRGLTFTNKWLMPWIIGFSTFQAAYHIYRFISICNGH